MPVTKPTIRLFVSSSFKDFEAEREILQREVFPKLRQLCQAKGLRFQAIDLRWGISDEAGRDNQTLRICLRELKRCQQGHIKPNFLILLGDRYGWRPLPYKIAVTEFNALRAQLTEDERRLIEWDELATGNCASWHEGEMPARTGWYRLDQNAMGSDGIQPGIYVLQPRKFNAPANFTDEQKQALSIQESDDWARIESEIRKALLRAIQALGWAEDDPRRVKYEASATHQEILHGALNFKTEEVRQHVHALVRTIRLPPEESIHEDFVDRLADGCEDTEARAQLDRLKSELISHLGKNNFHRYTLDRRNDGRFTDDDLKDFCDQTWKQLSQVVENQIASLTKTSPAAQEDQAHQDFGAERCQRFVGRREPLDSIAAYLNEGVDKPLTVAGPSGSGKSAVMAKSAQAARVANPKAQIIARYIGATPASSDLIQLLRNLVAEIRQRYPASVRERASEEDTATLPDDGEIPYEYHPLLNAFHEALQRSSAEKPLWLFIDALDQLNASHNAHTLVWLPGKLPAHVRLVVSTAQPSPDGKDTSPGVPTAPKAQGFIDPRPAIMAALTLRLDATRHVKLAPLTGADGEQMLDRLLAVARRTLLPKQRQALLDTFQAEGSPLWLRTAAQEAIRLASWQDPPAFASTTQGLLGQVLHRLSRNEEHGELLVSRTLSYLACARHGLAEDEILDILGGDKEVMADFRRRSPNSPKVDSLPVAVWVRVYGDLEPFLREGTADKTALLGFYHWQMAEVVEQIFLKGGIRFFIHRQIDAYFRRLAYPALIGQWKDAPLRALSELPYQRLHGNRILAAKHLLCDLHFIVASFENDLLEQLLSDIETTLQRPELHDIHTVNNAVISGIVAIRRRPDLALQTIVNRLRNESLTPIVRRHLRLAEATLDKAGVWLCSMTPFGTAQSVNNVVAVSPSRGLFHVLTDTFDVDDYDLGTHRFVEKHILSNTLTLNTLLCIHPQNGKIAWMNRDGIVYIDTESTPLRLRMKQHCLTFFGGGLAGITPEGDLAYFDIQAQTITRHLVESISTFSSISIASNLAAGVLISGDRLPTQRIYLLSMRDGLPHADDWPTPDSPISAAYLDNKNALLLATRGRQLLLFNINSRQLTQVSYRTIGGRPVRGVVKQCKLTCWQDNPYAVLATDNSEIFVWDISSNALHSRGAYCGLRENDSALRTIETWPDQGKIIIATTSKIEIISIAGDDEIVLKNPITECSVTPDGWLITVDTIGKCVTWYKDGNHYHDWIDLNHEPTTVSACEGTEGAAFVGYNTGTVGILQPNKQPDSEDGLILFDRTVVSIIALDKSRVLAASVDGQYKIIGIQPSRCLRDIKLIEPYRIEQFIRCLGQSDDFVSCGRGISGDCNTSVIVIRSDDTREVVFETKDIVNDLAITENGQAIHAVFKTKICRYRKTSGRWNQVFEHDVEATHIVNCGQDILAVVHHDKGLNWLELWKAESNYKTITTIELPFQCTSLCSAGDWIAVGAVDGRHCRILTRQTKRKPIIWNTVKQVVEY